MCEKIHFFMVKVSFVGIVMFPLLTTALNYFVGDLKEDSYLLPTPATYVSGCRSCSNCTVICVFLIPFLKATIQLAYAVWILAGNDLRRCGHFVYAAHSDNDHMLFGCIMSIVCRISQRYSKRCATIECLRNAER